MTIPETAAIEHGQLAGAQSGGRGKSDGDAGIRELRARGWSAAEVIGQAAALGGLLEVPRPVSAGGVAELVRHFS